MKKKNNQNQKTQRTIIFWCEKKRKQIMGLLKKNKSKPVCVLIFLVYVSVLFLEFFDVCKIKKNDKKSKSRFRAPKENVLAFFFDFLRIIDSA
jgi:hypothetical protein